MHLPAARPDNIFNRSIERVINAILALLETGGGKIAPSYIVDVSLFVTSITFGDTFVEEGQIFPEKRMASQYRSLRHPTVMAIQ